jgi:hypothetical protein
MAVEATSIPSRKSRREIGSFIPRLLSKWGHLANRTFSFRASTKQALWLVYAYAALISFVFLRYLFVSFYCDWKWTIWEGSVVVKEKRGAATLDFCRHESKKLDSCLAAGIPEARRGPERLDRRTTIPGIAPFVWLRINFLYCGRLVCQTLPRSAVRLVVRLPTRSLSSRGAVLQLYVHARRLPATNEVP